MEYGPGNDICVGKFLSDGTWIDFGKHWASVCPKVQHFLYADDGKDAALLLKDFHIRVGQRVFSALAGFDFDAGSIPRAFWASIGHPYMAKTFLQFTIHDEAYVMNLIPQKEADDLLLETLAAFGENTWYTRNRIWLAVKMGGGWVYPKTAKELALYKDYVFMTDLSKPTAPIDCRLLGKGPRLSVRPEITLD
jgi:hypothetical protein